MRSAKMASLLLLAVAMSGCAAQGVERKLEDVQDAVALTAEGELLYKADRNKTNGYGYCLLSTRASREGKLRLAVELATKALYLGQRSRNPALTARAAGDLAVAFGFAGKLGRSTAFAQLALSEADKAPPQTNGLGYTRLIAWRVLGENLSREGRHREALAAFEQAQRFTSWSRDGLLSLAIANAQLRAGEYADAQRSFQRVIGVDASVEAQARRGLGDVLAVQGRWREALGEYGEALKAAQRAENLYERVWALERMGRAAVAVGDRAAGIRHLTAAVDGAERLRAKFRSEEFRSGFFGSHLLVYEEALLALIEDGKVGEAFAMSERSRSRALRDLMTDRVTVVDESAVPAVREAEEIGEQIAGLRIDERYDGADSAGRHRGAELEAKLRGLTVRVKGRETSVDFIVPAASGAVNVADIRRQLPAGGALLEYHVLDHETFLWRLDRDEFKLVRIPMGRMALRQRVEGLRAAFAERASTARELSRELFDLLVAPALSRHAGALVIVPHDALHYLPFAALWDGQQFLAEQASLNVLPSASLLTLLPRPDRVGGSARVVAFGNPLSEPQYGLKPLPAAEREVRSIAAMYAGTQLFIGPEASKTNFLVAGPRGEVIHVAAHALYDDLDPLASAIFLAADDRRDGRLDAQEIFGLDLHGSRLATLSACETGLGRLSRGDEVIGLSRAFLAAGIRSLVLSLWSVDDESTGELMTAFYRQLREAEAPEALRRAQLALMKRRPEPYFWAPFFVLDLSR